MNTQTEKTPLNCIIQLLINLVPKKMKLNNEYEMTDKQREMLEDVQSRIKLSVPRFDELLKEAIDQGEEETFEQTM